MRLILSPDTQNFAEHNTNTPEELHLMTHFRPTRSSLITSILVLAFLCTMSSTPARGDLVVLSAPQSQASGQITVSNVPNSNGYGDLIVGSTVFGGGTAGLLAPPLPPGYMSGNPIGSSADSGIVSFSAGQNPTDTNALLTQTYQSYTTQSLTFGADGGMNVSYGGNVNLASSNFLDPTQPFAFNNMITGGVTTYGAGTVFIVNSQASTYSSTYIGVTGSPTTVSISIKDPSLSITNAGNLQGVTMASISNSMEIFPIHTLEGWNPNPSSPGWSYDQFYNSNLQNDPTLNLTHYQFTEFAVYRTQLDQNGNTVTNQDDAGALSYVADGPTTIQQDVYSGYNAGRTINVTFTLIPGYVYQLDSLMNAMVIFGSEDLTQPGSGTYLDPTTSLQVSFQSTSVPEPTSLALLSLGGIGLMAVRLRMRRLPA